VQLVGHEAAARSVLRDRRRDPPVDLGVERVAQPQLEPAAEHVAHRRAEVGPPAGRGHDVQAEGEATRRELLDLHLEVVEVRAERAPAVDDEEHVAVPVVRTALRPARPVGLDRVDAVGAEVLLAPVDDAGHLGDDPAHDVGLGPRADAGHVRQPRQAGEGSAAEVEDEELRLQRGRGQRHPRHHRPQRGALAAARPADDRDVAGPAGQVHRQRVAALLARPVHGAQGHDEAAQRPPLPRHQPELRVDREVAHELVQGVGNVEWRQPDLVRLGTVADHVRDREVQQRLLVPGLDGRGLGLRVGHRDVELLHLRDRERQDPLQLAALVAAYADPTGWRPRHVRRLEPHHRGGVGLQVGEAGDRRQLVGVGYAEHGARLLCREGPQADPVGEV
jgi:hypothetical protein